jgi:hypothetical protein
VGGDWAGDLVCSHPDVGSKKRSLERNVN